MQTNKDPFDFDRIYNYKESDDQNQLKQYECCICVGAIARNPYSCNQHHLLCYQCFQQILKCPQCEYQFDKSLENKYRNRLARNLISILKINCIYNKFGCPEILNCEDQEVSSHEQVCQYRNQQQEINIQQKNQNQNNSAELIPMDDIKFQEVYELCLNCQQKIASYDLKQHNEQCKIQKIIENVGEQSKNQIKKNSNSYQYSQENVIETPGQQETQTNYDVIIHAIQKQEEEIQLIKQTLQNQNIVQNDLKKQLLHQNSLLRSLLANRNNHNNDINQNNNQHQILQQMLNQNENMQSKLINNKSPIKQYAPKIIDLEEEQQQDLSGSELSKILQFKEQYYTNKKQQYSDQKQLSIPQYQQKQQLSNSFSQINSYQIKNERISDINHQQKQYIYEQKEDIFQEKPIFQKIKFGIKLDYTFELLQIQGFKIVYNKPYCHPTSFQELIKIKENCTQNSIICVGAAPIISNKILVCCIDRAYDALQQTYSKNKARQTTAGNYFYLIEKFSFGFAPNCNIDLIPYDNSRQEPQKKRLSWNLDGNGGNRASLQMNLIDQRHRISKIIAIKY